MGLGGTAQTPGTTLPTAGSAPAAQRRSRTTGKRNTRLLPNLCPRTHKRTHARTHTCARKRAHAHAHSMHKSTYMRALSLAHALATVHVHKYTCVRRSLKCTNAAPFTLSWFESPPTSFVRGGGEFAGAPCERRHSPFTPTPAPSLPPSLPLPLSPSSRPYSSQELKDNRGGSPSARPHSRHTRCAPTRANTRVRNLCSRELSVASISLN